MSEQPQKGTQPIQDQPTASTTSLAWGKLHALTPGLASQPLTLPSTTIGRKTTNSIVINDIHLSGVHCKILHEAGKAFVEDLSSNGTFINNTKMSKGAKIEIKHGDEIWLLHQSKVAADAARGYRVELVSFEEEQRKKVKEDAEAELKRRELEIAKELEKRNVEEIKKVEDEKKKITEESNQLMKALKQQITCCICLQLMHLPVTVHPCNHRFCGSCLTGLIKSKQQNCAQCRKQITTAQRDSSFNSLIEDYLKRHPEEKRSKEEEAASEKANMFGHDTVDIREVIHGKKKAVVAAGIVGRPVRAVRGSRGRGLFGRAVVDDSDEELSASSDGPPTCSQCRVARNGFQCASDQRHANCVTCGKMIAIRPDPALAQCCLLCNQYFCNLYNPPCATFGVKLARLPTRQSDIRLDQNTFRGNAYQFSILKDYMKSKKITSKDIFNTMLRDHIDKGTFRYIVHRKIMKIPPLISTEITLARDSAVCDICWVSLWFQMVLVFRGTIAPELPSSVSSRPDCYYGVNCSTMNHKPDHARKLNHCCFQTKF